tara:strand:+ start:7660 stop:8520 length:861 start_codon:yes stop_codon:yes gene_type:complete
MVNSINKKNYLSINAEMLGRAYKVAKTDEPFMGAGGILIWSSGHGLNIMGTDRHSLIFFHDENGYFSDDFHHKTLFFCSSKFIENKKFMRSLLKRDNQNKQVRIEDSTEKESLVRSVFLKQKVGDVFTFKLQESRKTRANKSAKFSIFLDSEDHKRGIKLNMIEKIFMKIPTKSSVPTAYDINKIKLLDQIYLRQGKNSRKPQPATIHFTNNNMLCGIRQNAFLISMPYSMGEMTLKDVFKSSEGDDKNIFEIALSKKKYKLLFNDLKEYFPDLGFEKNRSVHTSK